MGLASRAHSGTTWRGAPRDTCEQGRRDTGTQVIAWASSAKSATSSSLVDGPAKTQMASGRLLGSMRSSVAWLPSRRTK